MMVRVLTLILITIPGTINDLTLAMPYKSFAWALEVNGRGWSFKLLLLRLLHEISGQEDKKRKFNA